MNLNHLSIFHAVASEQSVSRGAQRLMISQPAVSKQLAQFERDLGVALFDRVRRGVRLTESGQMLLDYARRIFLLEADAEAALLEMRGIRRGTLRIGASPTIGVYLLPEVLVQFRGRFPGITAHLEISSSPVIAHRLLAGELDVGFAEVASQSGQIEQTVFGTDTLSAIVPPGHALNGNRVTARRFCQEPFVVRDTGSETRSFVEKELASRGLSIQPAMSLGSTEAIKRAVSAGVGVAIVSGLATALELEAKRLGVADITGLLLKRPLYILQVRGASPRPALKEFLKILTQSVGSRAGTGARAR